MTDWRTVSKIDAHIHLMPPDVIAANQGYGDKFADYGSVSDYYRLMEQYHIEAAFIMPFNDPYMLSMDFQAETVHRNLLAMCGSGRLFCFADIDLRRDLSDTIRILEDALREDAFLGIKIHPSNAAYPVDGAYYRRIFDWAAETDTPVEIHSYPRAHLDDDVCSPARIRRIREDYPALRICAAHLGGFQFEALYDCDVYANLSAVLPDLVNNYGIAGTNEILRRFGTDRLIFATDYPDSRCLKPEEIYDRYFEMLGQMDFSQEEAEGICRRNVLRFLKKDFAATCR